MLICGLEKMSMVDYGEKLAATIFVPSCDFACPFCQNSDLVMGNNLQFIAESEIFEYLQKRKNLLDGVVVSGGEPTLMPDLAEFIKKIHTYGLSVKLDTNGTRFEVLKNLVESGLVNYVAMDVKNCLDSYAKTSGVIDFCSDDVKKSVEFLKQNKVDYEFRTTLVSQLHTKTDIQNMAEWLKGAKLLFLQKFEDKGTCIKHDLTCVPLKTALEYQKMLCQTIDTVKLRGY